MDKAVVLKKTREKLFSETEIIIKELNFKILCLSVPYKRKIKRKDKEKLLKLLSNYEKVFTTESDFCEYEKGVSKKTWLTFFVSEGLGYILKRNGGEKIAVECNEMCSLLKETVLMLGEKYRIIELYSSNKEKLLEFVSYVYNSVGLPVNIKQHNEGGYDARYIVKISENISILDSECKKEYKDLKIEYLYPLNKYQEIPLEKIIKSALEEQKYLNLIQKGMVKIRGEISK